MVKNCIKNICENIHDNIREVKHKHLIFLEKYGIISPRKNKSIYLREIGSYVLCANKKIV